MIDFSKPLRFTKVQNNDHATYRPQLVGNYVNAEGARRWVVMSRNWDSAPGVLIYNHEGVPINTPDLTSSGIFDPQLVNGDEIHRVRGKIGGASVSVTFDGNKAVRVELE